MCWDSDGPKRLVQAASAISVTNIRDDADELVVSQRQQILVAGNDDFCLGDNGSGDDVIVTRIAAGPAHIRQRIGYHEGFLTEGCAPSEDGAIGMAIRTPQATVQQRPPRLLDLPGRSCQRRRSAAYASRS
jgi:hypothetical protein